MTPSIAGTGGYPAPVQVRMGADWVPATAHGDRLTRHGNQILVTYHDHLTWVAAYRVRPHNAAAGTHGADSKGRKSPA